MIDQPKDDNHWEQYRKPKMAGMSSSYNNILLGIIIGVIGTYSIFFSLEILSLKLKLEKNTQKTTNPSRTHMLIIP